MIQAGTIRIGSGCTLSVVGAYWMSSISRLRNTTLPGVVARSLPTTNFSVPTGGRPLAARSQSSTKFQKPRTRFCPASACVLARISGLVRTKLDGEKMSSICRNVNSSMRSWCADTPRTPVAALYHHCCCSRNVWYMTLKGHCCHAGSSKRLSCGNGEMQGSPRPPWPAQRAR